MPTKGRRESSHTYLTPDVLDAGLPRCLEGQHQISSLDAEVLTQDMIPAATAVERLDAASQFLDQARCSSEIRSLGDNGGIDGGLFVASPGSVGALDAVAVESVAVGSVDKVDAVCAVNFAVSIDAISRGKGGGFNYAHGRHADDG